MSWSRFKFYTSESLRLIEEGKKSTDAFVEAKNSIVSTEFGDELHPQSIQSKVFKTMIDEYCSEAELKPILKIYNGLDTRGLQTKPNRIRRMGAYLSYLTFMFIVMSSIYFLLVIPEALSSFEAMGFKPPANFVWFADNWIIISMVNVYILAAAIFISSKIKNMFDYNIEIQNSLFYKYILPKKLKSKYERLISLILLPIYISKKSNMNNVLVDYYCRTNNSVEDVSSSLSILINEKVDELRVLFESYITKIYVFSAIVIVLTIFQFISSIYSSLFIAGEAI